MHYDIINGGVLHKKLLVNVTNQTEMTNPLRQGVKKKLTNE